MTCSKFPGLSIFVFAAACTAAFAAEDPAVIRLAELDRICEAARNTALKPVRAELIEKCVTVEKRPRSDCETELSNYGLGQTNRWGALVNRMYTDLPECTYAYDQRQAYLRKLGGR